MAEMRVYQRMLSGRRLNLLDPSLRDIDIHDIAHGLSFQARWNGQTKGDFPYSVAQHSLLVERLFRKIEINAAPEWCLVALLHDAPEYVIGDMIGPVKNMIGGKYEELDARLNAAILERFGVSEKLPSEIKDKIKTADKASAWAEAVQIAGFSHEEATECFGDAARELVENRKIKPKPPWLICHKFIQKYKKLRAKMRKSHGGL